MHVRTSFVVLLPILAAALLSACGNSNALLVSTCHAEVERKGVGLNLTIDDSEIESSIATQADGTLLLKGSATVDGGSERERTMPFSCVMSREGETVSLLRVEIDPDFLDPGPVL